MNVRQSHFGVFAASFGAASALGSACAIGLLLPTASVIVQGTVLVVCVVGAGALAALLVNRSAQRWSDLQLALESLVAMDWQQRDQAILSDSLPVVGKRRGDQIVSLLNDCLKQYASRVQDLEQSRAALEIRARRSTTEAQRISAIFGALSDPVLAVDNYGQIVLANDTAEQVLKLDRMDHGKRALAQLGWCEELVGLLSETGRRRGPCQRTAELELTDDRGEKRSYKISARTIAGASESCDGGEGVVAVLQDISQQKAAQKRNAEFVSAVSHEMKTPLAGIKAYVELLADGDAEDEQTREEFLEVINGQANRLQRLIDNLLNLARIEAGVVSVNKTARPLNEILEEALRLIQPAAEQKQITLRSDLSPLYLSVHADRDMMLQTAINLLSNAVKYTPDGGQVTLRSRLVDDQVRFEIEDTGVGLSPDDCHKVFEKFYRVKSQKDMAPGTGLGLPLAKHIVEEIHGGTLTVTSEIGRGSTFTVSLPGSAQLN
jgi:two-component system, OmpR family, phosphate regulon sensor histidine kinase PhoR